MKLTPNFTGFKKNLSVKIYPKILYLQSTKLFLKLFLFKEFTPFLMTELKSRLIKRTHFYVNQNI